MHTIGLNFQAIDVNQFLLKKIAIIITYEKLWLCD
jgi:hypothetical protein